VCNTNASKLYRISELLFLDKPRASPLDFHVQDKGEWFFTLIPRNSTWKQIRLYPIAVVVGAGIGPTSAEKLLIVCFVCRHFGGAASQAEQNAEEAFIAHNEVKVLHGPNESHHWRRACDSRYETETESRRPVHVSG
jgi:hypothetical protein